MPLSIKVNLRVTGHCNQGGRKYMEDMFSVAYQQTSDDKDLEYAFFGIFDGHGGGEAATFAKEHLMDIIVKQKNFWSDKDEDVLRAIRDGYVNTHYAMWRELDKWPKTASGLPSTAGTTASIAFIRKGKIYIGHVGDSGIVLGYQDDDDLPWKAKALTADHKPESGPEMTRIHESGGKVVSKSGVPRVVWNRPRIGHKGPVRRSTHIDEIPFLAVARSLGDLWSYNSELDTFVVSPEPDVKVITVDVKSHRCLIFGTDGLWNMLTPQAAVAIVQAAERYNEKHFIASQQTGDGQSDSQRWINPSKSLVDRALERWSATRLRADNTSVVTLMLDPPGPSRGEVLLNRKKERICSNKCTTKPSSSYTTSARSERVESGTNPTVSSIPTVEKHHNYFQPQQPISPSWIVHENPVRNTTNDETHQCSVDTKTFIPYQYEKIEANERIECGEVDGEANVRTAVNSESIQVAEISSSDASNDTIKSDTAVSDSFQPITQEGNEVNSIHESNSDTVIRSNSLMDALCESKKVPNNDNTHGSGVIRSDVSSRSFNDCEYVSRLRRSAPEPTADLNSYAESSCSASVRNTPADQHKRCLQSNALGLHVEKRQGSLGVGRNELRSTKLRRQCPNSNSSHIISPASLSQSIEPNQCDMMGPPVDSRLKRESPLRHEAGMYMSKSPLLCTKRRHSSTFQSAEDVTYCEQEPCSKRRTRSEDQRCPTDENNPINQTKQFQDSQQPRRLRWPNSCTIGSRSRTNITPTTSCQITGVVANKNQEKLPSPNSFSRRSIEKKVTSVKTIRRPSINGSNRVQLRGSFALRDWDQAKSSRRTSCSGDRSRINRTMNSEVAETPSSTTPQRWLRSDTIAATPIKTLRSRNVDITGHTVPPQIAHQYGIVKQNRISLSTKLKISNVAKVKLPAALVPDKLKQSPPAVSAGVSGIAKRVKSSPYNLNARSLGTRSRLKRLSK